MVKPCKRRHIFLHSSSVQIDILPPIWKIVHCVSFRETPSSQFCAAAVRTMVKVSKFRPKIMVTFSPSKSVRSWFKYLKLFTFLLRIKSLLTKNKLLKYHTILEIRLGNFWTKLGKFGHSAFVTKSPIIKQQWLLSNLIDGS